MAECSVHRMQMTQAIRTLLSEWSNCNTSLPVSLLNHWTWGQVNLDGVIGIKHNTVSSREWEVISFLQRRESVLLPYIPYLQNLFFVTCQ